MRACAVGCEIWSWTGGRRVPAERGPSPTLETPEVLTPLRSGIARRDSAHLPDERWRLSVGKGPPQASVGNGARCDTPLSLSVVGKCEPPARRSRCHGQQGGTRPSSRERADSFRTLSPQLDELRLKNVTIKTFLPDPGVHHTRSRSRICISVLSHSKVSAAAWAPCALTRERDG